MSTTDVGTTGNEVIALLTLQRDLYRRLSELARAQQSLITDNQPEILLKTLTERQSIINRLARLNEQLGPYRRTWERTYSNLRDDQRGLVNGLLDDINSMLRTILHRDQEDSQRLAARKQTAAAELREIQTHSTANTAYGAPAISKSAIAADITG
ncbi:MAG: hypothetical protein AB7N71_01750 [Phycisphaerae bacterium]